MLSLPWHVILYITYAIFAHWRNFRRRHGRRLHCLASMIPAASEANISHFHLAADAIRPDGFHDKISRWPREMIYLHLSCHLPPTMSIYHQIRRGHIVRKRRVYASSPVAINAEALWRYCFLSRSEVDDRPGKNVEKCSQRRHGRYGAMPAISTCSARAPANRHYQLRSLKALSVHSIEIAPWPNIRRSSTMTPLNL